MSTKSKLSKANRLAFIASLFAGNMSAVMHANTHDLREEAHLVTHGQDSGSLPVNDDLPELSSTLPFKTHQPLSAKAEQVENDRAILSRAEREEAKRDLLAYRIRKDLTTARNPFALTLVS